MIPFTCFDTAIFLLFEDTERSYQEGEDQGEQHSLAGKAREKVEEVTRSIRETGEDKGERIQETFQGSSEQGKDTTEYRGDESHTEFRGGKSRGGGVLQAIGETVVEIAQTTKDLVIGEGETGEKILGYRLSQVGEGKEGEAEHRQ